MSDTITPEERAELIAHVNSGYMTISGEGLKRALAALEQAEAENARLTKERDWLADKVGDAYGKPCDKDLNFTSGDCPMGHLWGDDCCLHTDKPTCWAAEAARKAVAAEEG